MGRSPGQLLPLHQFALLDTGDGYLWWRREAGVLRLLRLAAGGHDGQSYRCGGQQKVEDGLGGWAGVHIQDIFSWLFSQIEGTELLESYFFLGRLGNGAPRSSNVVAGKSSRMARSF